MTKSLDRQYPRLTDNDRGEITVTYDGRELRGWSYANETEHYLKIRMAREYVEGFGDGFDHGRDIGFDQGHKEGRKEHQ